MKRSDGERSEPGAAEPRRRKGRPSLERVKERFGGGEERTLEVSPEIRKRERHADLIEMDRKRSNKSQPFWRSKKMFRFGKVCRDRFTQVKARRTFPTRWPKSFPAVAYFNSRKKRAGVSLVKGTVNAPLATGATWKGCISSS